MSNGADNGGTWLRRLMALADMPIGRSPGVAGEPLLTLFNKVTLLAGQTDGYAVQILGARDGAGTSTIARELARLAAGSLHAPVLLLDADPTSAGQCPHFPGLPTLSLHQALEAGLPLERAILTNAAPHLAVARLAAPLPDPRAAVEWVMPVAALDNIMAGLRQRFRWIVADSASPQRFAFSYVLSRAMDASLIVLEAEKTRLPVAQELIRQIRKNGGHPAGGIINKRRLVIPDAMYRWV